MPENMNCYSNKTAQRIIKEIKNLERSLESTTRNCEGTKKAKKKLEKIQNLINEAQDDGLLNQNEYNDCSNLLSEPIRKLFREKFEGKC
ncbi:hypothetical protein LXN10_13445 [Arcobacter sp. KX21116]|uniref:hypothetical protein n=1 Tax=Arcobacter iocasae TaxID=2906515 RepID=UPI0035D3E63D